MLEKTCEEIDMNSEKYSTTDQYISTFPPEVQAMLNQLRTTIQQAAPDALEKISYQMPTFWQGRNLVHFAAFKNHIGFYPGAAGIEAFKPEIATYKNAKGSVQFPLDKPLPLELIARIVQFRVQQEINRAKR
jgi:uncharacterized protein YdhG (YjbR/CyaY superfamily)